MGTTGFDSKISKNVSIPRNEVTTRKTYFTFFKRRRKLRFSSLT